MQKVIHFVALGETTPREFWAAECRTNTKNPQLTSLTNNVTCKACRRRHFWLAIHIQQNG